MEQHVQLLTLTASLERLPEVLEAVGGAAIAAGLPEARCDHLALAVEEAFVNICRHAYAGNAGRIDVRVGHRQGEVSIELADEGPPFDPLATAAPDPDRPLDDRTPGGMGIMLLKTITDEVRYSRDQERNVLAMVVRTRDA